MTRVCFIGNSHLAAIKAGWDAVSAEYPFLDVSFFGLAGRLVEEIGLTPGGRLGSVDARATGQLRQLWGKTELDPNEVDLICLVGMGTGLVNIDHYYRDFRSDECVSRDGTFRSLSPACFEAAVFGHFASSIAAKLAVRIGSISPRPVAIVVQPALAEGGPDDKVWLNQALTSGDIAYLTSTFERALAALPNVSHVLFQEPSTLRNPAFTKREFSVGSMPLRKSLTAHPDTDAKHMNGQYGVVVIGQVAKLVQSFS